MTSIDLYGDGIGKVELIDHMGTDLTIVNAARVSYGKHKDVFDDSDRKLIRYLLVNKHTSPVEHVAATFRFTVPLFVRSQHHRSRTWAYNEVSRRFTADNIQFYFPPCWRTQSKNNKQMSDEDFQSEELDWMVREHCEVSYAKYQRMIEAGVAREMARMILPQNLYTQYYGTVSLHNALHFLKLRLHPHSQWEIQRVAIAMRDILMGVFPETMKIWEELNA